MRVSTLSFRSPGLSWAVLCFLKVAALKERSKNLEEMMANMDKAEVRAGGTRLNMSQGPLTYRGCHLSYMYLYILYLDETMPCMPNGAKASWMLQ